MFIIGPRINAAGRIQDGKQAVDLLISANRTDALGEGKTLMKGIRNDASLICRSPNMLCKSLKEDMLFSKKKGTVLFHPSWHKGVIGIVASRMTDKYYKPTVILTESNGFVTGSARSVKDFDIYNAIEACSDLLEQFGGHMYAAGLTMKPENVEKFQERFEEVVSSTIEERMLTQEIEIDAKINLGDITTSFF